MSVKKILVVDSEGSIEYDSNKILKSDLNSIFLDSLFRDALLGNVEFRIDEKTPISKLFMRIQEETASTSEFSEEVEELRQEFRQNYRNLKDTEEVQSMEEIDLNDILTQEDFKWTNTSYYEYNIL